MAKQKIVLKLYMEDQNKRRKALRTAVGICGIQSASVEGDKIVVIGEGVDSIALTVMLRKQMCYVDLVSVSSADEKKDDKKDKSEGEKSSLPYNFGAIQPFPVVISDSYDPNSCIIM